MIDPLKEAWVAVGPSVFVDRTVKARGPTGSNYHFRPGVAFNVGNDVAQRIAAEHNRSLQKTYRHGDYVVRYNGSIET